MLITVAEMNARADSIVGIPAAYGLGAGGRNPALKTPLQGGRADCSGTQAWVMRRDRKLDHPLYLKINGGWLETTAIWSDAKIYKTGLFYALDRPIVGSFAVVPDLDGHQGHIAYVRSLLAGGDLGDIIDCSSSNPEGRAIQRRDGKFFRGNPRTVYAWYEGAIEQAAA